MNITLMRSRPLLIAIICAGVALASSAARADLKAVETTKIDLSQMTINGQPLTDQQLDVIKSMPMFKNGGMQATLYVKGTRTRIETPMAVAITDSVAKTVTTLNPADKTYFVQPVPDAHSNPMISKAKVTVNDLNTTKKILGYTCHGFQLTMNIGLGVFDATLWAAPDVGPLPTGVSTGNPQLDTIMGKVNGFPLEMDGAISSDMFGKAGMSYLVASIATDPLPDTLFAPPADFTKVDAPAPAMMPGGLGAASQSQN